MLAISLHAVRDDLRDMLVPINKKYPLKDLLDACRRYPGLSNARRITFEYVMLKDVNDSVADAKELVRLLKGIPAKINLIPFNPWPGTNYQCSDWETIETFADTINNAGYASPIRTPRGRDILAACGQLKSESERMRKTDRLALEAMMIVRARRGLMAAGLSLGMTRVLIYLARFALILAGYAIASLAASAFLHVVSLGSLGFTSGGGARRGDGLDRLFDTLRRAVRRLFRLPAVDPRDPARRDSRQARLALSRDLRRRRGAGRSSASSAARRRPATTPSPTRALRWR